MEIAGTGEKNAYSRRELLHFSSTSHRACLHAGG